MNKIDVRRHNQYTFKSLVVCARAYMEYLSKRVRETRENIE